MAAADQKTVSAVIPAYNEEKTIEAVVKEALSHVNYENALTFFNFKGIRGSDDQESIEFYSQVIHKYLNCFMVEK